MTILELGELETQLVALADRAAAGEEIILSKAGRPVARIVAAGATVSRAPRVPGIWKGRIHMRDDFEDPLPEEAMAAFRGAGPRDA